MFINSLHETKMNKTTATIISSILLWFTFSLLTAQEVSERKLNPFSNIEVSQGIIVHLSEGIEQKVEVVASEDMILSVITESKGGTLKISIDDRYKRLQFDKLQVRVNITLNKLASIQAAGNSQVFGITNFTADKLTFTVTSGADVRLEKGFDAGELVVNVNNNGKLSAKGKASANSAQINSASGGDITISNLEVANNINCGTTSKGKMTIAGRAPEALLTATSHSDIRMKAFEAQKVNAVATTSASIGITARNFLAATATYGATISYWGKPKSINKEATSGGKIK